jgi:hypothetical protein
MKSSWKKSEIAFVAVLEFAFVIGLVLPECYGQTGQTVSFADVRRILSDKCFHCHGPDRSKRQSNLRLDDRDSAFAGGDSGPAIRPGSPETSLLTARIMSASDSERMPPPHSAKHLTDAEKELLKQWIAEGAKYEIHWAYKKITEPLIPNVDPILASNAIDCFIFGRLKEARLTPNPLADISTIHRRLHLDLVGLLPDRVITELDDEVSIETLVDELLNSPHFGEKWGREWLDAARYADSDGFEKDKPRSVSFYRDWVIKAWNGNQPYNEFVIEQLAGDLVPNANQETRVATGFLRNSMINEEGGADPEQFRMEAMFDRMDTIGKSILGLTIGCSQCHDHKYDPLSQEDYYRIFAFFNRSAEGSAPVYSPEQRTRTESIGQQIRDIDSELMNSSKEIDERIDSWEEAIRGNQSHWSIMRPAWNDHSLGGCKMLPQGDGSFLAQGYAPTKSEMWGSVQLNTVPVDRIHAVRLECLTDPNLPLGGPGRSIFGYGALTELKVFVAPLENPESKQPVKIVSATADLNPLRSPLPLQFADKSGKERFLGPIEYAIDGLNETAWSLDGGPGRTNRSRNAVFILEEPIEDLSSKILFVHLAQNHGGWNSDDNQNCNLGRIRFSVTNHQAPTADLVPRDIRQIIETVPVRSRTLDQRLAVFGYWRSLQSEYQHQTEQIERLWQLYPQPSSQLVYQELDDERSTRMLERGDFLKPGRLVSAGVPSFLHPLKSNKAEPDRLDFARWSVDDQSPLASRVIVNRLWQSMFGVGLVRSSEDLGSQSEPPTHPELLDYLACQLVRNGWDLKRLIREIVLSKTYQQSSVVSPEHLRVDPVNRLLARSPRVRVMGESVRDIALMASGLLDQRIGGEPVFPPAPDFLFQPPVSYGPKVWKESHGGDRYRRSIYTFRFRSVPYPSLQVFDTPNGDTSCVRRSTSNTPLQALTMLNEPLFVECSQSLARLSFIKLPTSQSDRERFQWMANQVLQRPLTPGEISSLTQLLQMARDKLADDTIAKQVAGWESSSLDSIPKSGQSPQVLAAWSIIARAFLNLDETITRE